MIIGIQIMRKANPHAAHQRGQLLVIRWSATERVRINWIRLSRISQSVRVVNDKREFLEMIRALIDCGFEPVSRNTEWGEGLLTA